MASLIKKKIGGHVYYYARECKRVNGKPKIVWQKYLGKAEDIIKAVEDRDKVSLADEVIVTRFGAVAALYDIAKRWDLAGIIDRVVGKRAQGLSVGNYMLVAAINRCVCPRSKRQIGKWFFETPLRRWIPAKESHLTSQRFWDNMALLDEEKIRRCEEELTRALIKEFGVDTSCLLYDTTNFITYIDTFNEANTLAQRGRSKQGRGDLRIIGLALLVSRDFHIPLMHEVYRGNTHDSVEFGSIVERLVERYKVLASAVDTITVIFDKGNNSEGNIEKLSGTRYHFVGSLKLSQMKELLDIGLEEYEDCRGELLQGVKAYRTRKEVMGSERTVVITYNEELFLTQSQSILREVRKRTRKLKGIVVELNRWHRGEAKRGKRPTVSGVKKKVKDILKGQYMKEVIKVEVVERDGLPWLSYRVDHKALEEIFRRRLGKSILFTDNDTWTNEEIILAYRGQFMVEDAFKAMKNPHFVSFSPMWHWTDHNIRVHAFYCVLALTLASLLRRELFSKGIDVSIPKAIEELSGINEVIMVKHHPGGKSSGVRVMLSRMTPEQKRMFDALGLSRYAEVSS